MSRTAYNAAYYAANREKLSARAYARYIANPIEMCAKTNAYRAADPEKVRTQRAAYYSNHRKSECARVAAYRIKNNKKVNAKNARRRALKRNQVCSCCTLREIEHVYLTCPRGHEVDHEIPLALGGLHCIKNLQVLGRKEHKAKTAKDLRDIAAFRAVKC